jgi:type IV pilus assembly protein PilM
MGKNIVGVDLTSWGIRAVEIADATKARPTVVKYASMPLPEGAITRGEVAEPTTVATAIRQLWTNARFTSKSVVLGMGNSRVLARDLSVPRMSIERIRESLPFQVQDMLPVPVEDALLDFYPISESMSEQGPMVNGLLVAAVKDAVSTNVKAIQLAGLNPTDVDLIPFALCRVLLRGANAAGTVAIVDIGGTTTTVVVAINGVPQFVRIIPAGGSDVTEAIARELDLTKEQAETSKRALGLSTVGIAVENRPIVEAIYRVAGDLVNGLRNTLNYFAAARPQEPVRALVLTGGGSRLIGLSEALAEATRIPVVHGNPLETITVGRSVGTDSIRGITDSGAVALGLALGSAA